MKIWIDLRFACDDLYSRFIVQIIQGLIKNEKHNEYIIYINHFPEWLVQKFVKDNIKIKKIGIKNWSFAEQTKFLKILKEDKNWLMLFFNHFKPIFYKWEYITVVWSLKDVYYMDFSSYFEKYKYLYLMEKNLVKSSKIVCLDQNTQNELIEKFDIKESKIEIMNWFFPVFWENESEEEIDEKFNLNIKTKYWIKSDFFIYSWWNSIEKNYEKLISVFARLKNEWIKIDLVFLWHNISTNLNLRSQIIENEMEKNVYFLWEVPLNHKKYLYKECLATIFTSFYEPFPFRLADPLFFESHILSSDLKSIKNIFWDKIYYFSPISANSIYENVKKFLDEEKHKSKINYKNILDKYNEENTTKQLIEIIK